MFSIDITKPRREVRKQLKETLKQISKSLNFTNNQTNTEAYKVEWEIEGDFITISVIEVDPAKHSLSGKDKFYGFALIPKYQQDKEAEQSTLKEFEQSVIEYMLLDISDYKLYQDLLDENEV